MTAAESLSRDLRYSTNQRLSLEVALTRMAHPSSDISLDALAARIAALEAGAPAVAPKVAPPKEEPAKPAPASAYGRVEHAELDRAIDANPEPAPRTSPSSVIQHSSEDIAEMLGNQKTVERLWERVAKALGSEHRRASVMLTDAKVRGDAANRCLIVELPAGESFRQKNLSSGNMYEVAVKLVEDIFGSKVGLKYVLADSGNASANAQKVAPKPEPAPMPEPQPKPEPKPEPAPQPKLEPKPEPKPQPNPEPKPQSAPTPAPQPAERPQSAYMPEDAELASLFEDFFGDGIVIRDDEEPTQETQ